MTYNEAIKLYDGSRRKMAEHLGLSVQGVQHYSKNPDKELPPARDFMIKTKFGITDNPKVIMTAKAEVEKA
jgi:hypothetical protein|tara:strand:- start:21 stop:233 length:213 start_codon:yes stop_codon:yes gene_type:complete